MYNYDDGPYYEPTIADELLMEYQQKMKDALLDSVKFHLENIKTESEKVKAENEKLKKQVSEIAQRERELEYKKANLKQEVRSERLSELMKDFQVIYYRERTEYKEKPKCDKCNDNRQFEFISPLGTLMKENCECRTRTPMHIATEYACCEFSADSWGEKMFFHYKPHIKSSDTDDYYSLESSVCLSSIYSSDMDYSELKYNTLFKSKKDCQKYCDWLNKQDAVVDPNAPPAPAKKKRK